MNPDWSRDEAILALDLYVNEFGRRLPSSKADPSVVALSDLLQRLPIHPPDRRVPNFRNPAGVYRKLGNFQSVDPAAVQRGLSHVAKIDREVWSEFADDPNRLRHAADTIRKSAGSAVPATSAAESTVRPHSYWALAAKPSRFRVEDSVREQDAALWLVNDRHVQSGDRVVIWKLKDRDPVRGIVGFGVVLTDPAPMTDEDGYWVEPADGQSIAMRVRVRYIALPNTPLWVEGPSGTLLRDLVLQRHFGIIPIV